MRSVGVADHCGWAVLMSVSGTEVLDRRRVELLAPGLPMLAHHHEAQGLPEKEAVALIRKVTKSAEQCALAALTALTHDVPGLGVIALRACPALPESIYARVTTYSLQTQADGIMYRQALASAARELGLSVHWYEVKALDLAAHEALFAKTKAALGKPWQQDHRVAMAAALSAPGSRKDQKPRVRAR